MHQSSHWPWPWWAVDLGTVRPYTVQWRLRRCLCWGQPRAIARQSNGRERRMLHTILQCQRPACYMLRFLVQSCKGHSEFQMIFCVLADNVPLESIQCADVLCYVNKNTLQRGTALIWCHVLCLAHTCSHHRDSCKFPEHFPESMHAGWARLAKITRKTRRTLVGQKHLLY